LDAQTRPNPDVVIIAMGAVVPEAIEAVGLLAEDRRDVGLLVVTSADRLYGEWTAAHDEGRESHVESLLKQVPHTSALVSVLDGHPATLGWMGSIFGHRMRTLGVDHFGQSGSLPDLYRHHGIDTAAIMQAAERMAPGRPVRMLRLV